MSPEQAIELSQSLMAGAREIFEKHQMKVVDLIGAAISDYDQVKGRLPSVLVISRWLYDKLLEEDREFFPYLHPVLLDRDDMILLVG